MCLPLTFVIQSVGTRRVAESELPSTFIKILQSRRMMGRDEQLFFIDKTGGLDVEVAPLPSNTEPMTLDHQSGSQPLGYDGALNSEMDLGPSREIGMRPENAKGPYDVLADYIASAPLGDFRLRETARVLPVGSAVAVFERLDGDSESMEFCLAKKRIAENEILFSRNPNHQIPLNRADGALGHGLPSPERKMFIKEVMKNKLKLSSDAACMASAKTTDLAQAFCGWTGSLDNAAFNFLGKVNAQLISLVQNSNATPGDSFIISPTPEPIRRILEMQIRAYSLKMKYRGKKNQKIAIIFKTKASSIPHNWSSLLAKYFEKTRKRMLKKKGSVVPRQVAKVATDHTKNTAIEASTSITKTNTVVGANANISPSRPSVEPRRETNAQETKKRRVFDAPRSISKTGDVAGAFKPPLLNQPLGTSFCSHFDGKPVSLWAGYQVQILIRSKRGGLGKA